jgi:hypothetical protein
VPEQTKIVIAVIISNYSFLALLGVCQFGRCLSAFSHGRGANSSYSEVSVIDLRFGVSYHGQSAKPNGNATGRRLANVLGLTATVLRGLTQYQPNLFSHCK